MPSAPRPRRRSARASRLYWLGIMTWGVAAYFIGTHLAQYMTWRVNDLSVIPGAGVMMRDEQGALYYVSNSGAARQIYPELAPENSNYHCLDCTSVSGSLLAQTNKFCAAVKPADISHFHWQVPCRAWAPINEGPTIIAVLVFGLPFLLTPLLRITADLLRRQAQPQE